MKLANLVKSKYFCYFTYALMVINLLGYVGTGSMECVVIFALATFACKSCLSKNMCLCIFGGLFVSNIIFGCSKVKEGFREGLTAAECTTKKAEKETKEAAKAALETEISALATELEDCEDAADNAGDDLDTEAKCDAAGKTWDDTKDPKCEGFRNRHNRRNAVREAFSTIHRAVRSY